jgi:hypothetical protein
MNGRIPLVQGLLLPGVCCNDVLAVSMDGGLK